MNCPDCRHPAEEHKKDGCYHLEWTKREADGKEFITPCRCNKSRQQIEEGDKNGQREI